MTEPRIHVPIDATETVSSSSEGKVTKPSWNPNDGHSRSEQIRKAREEAWAEHVKATSNRLEDRLDRLELAFAALQREVMEGGKG